jgi:Na+/H+ antiporter NhaD/arsenite permease-like protein
MFTLMIVVFILGYAAIALEHPLKVNKSATALFLAVAMWVLFVIGGEQVLVSTASFQEYLLKNPGGSFLDWLSHHALLEHLGEISEILFFLLGAMTIVELVDSHEGFRIITDKIKTTNKVKLLWVISIITFFLSAVLDNLTTSIVMVALLRKLVSDKKERWFYAGMVIIAANSGGAFSPIGDVTTIMLWIGGHVTTVNIIVKTFIPSVISMVVPLALLSMTMKGNIQRQPQTTVDHAKDPTTPFERGLVFWLGIGSLLFVPVFKTITHLPPYIGILLGLSVLWIVTEIMHKSKNDEYRSKRTVAGVLHRVDTTSVLFFLGILLAVAALQTVGHLDLLAKALDQHVGNLYVINVIIGLLSSVVDNVPLVAGAMGMYQNTFVPDHYFWEMLAYCAGTGGSILIIGSAAGVAVMGMEKIDFIWYMKKISLWALIGYLAGAIAYWALSVFIFHA